MMDLTLVTFGLTFALGYGAVSAQPERSGQTDHCIKSSPHIIQCDLGCIPGFYGLYCNETCSSNCHLACSQDNGTCLTGCYPDWFKPNCTKECMGHCIKDVCDMRNGDCIYGCEDGYYGTACDKTCSENCTDGVCDEFGGCTCQKGVEDMACYLDCNDNCLNGQCAMDQNGRLQCLKGCQTGRTGPFCQEWCPEGCTSCNSEGICMDKLDSRVIKRELKNCLEMKGNECVCCKEKWRGVRCDIDCPACRYNYRQGKCIHSCDGGYFGEICHLSCPEYCANALNGRSGCEKDSGKCHSGCLQGFHGPKCQNKCSINCINSTCFQNNGSCVACERHKYGPQCENTCGHCKTISCGRNGTCTCEDGWYGPTCVHKCGNHCLSDICKIEYTGSHFCAGACVDGYTGDDCLSNCPKGCEKCNRKNGTCSQEYMKFPMGKNDPVSSPDSQSTVTIILAVVVCVIVTASVAVGVVCFVFRVRRRANSEGSNASHYQQNRSVNTPESENAIHQATTTPDVEKKPLMEETKIQTSDTTEMVPSSSHGTTGLQERFVDLSVNEREKNKDKETMELVDTPKKKSGNQQLYKREIKMANKTKNHDVDENGSDEVGLGKTFHDSGRTPDTKN